LDSIPWTAVGVKVLIDVVFIVVDGFFVDKCVLVVLKSSVLIGWLTLEVGLTSSIFSLQENPVHGS